MLEEIAKLTDQTAGGETRRLRAASKPFLAVGQDYAIAVIA
jgi:hypothetical protein